MEHFHLIRNKLACCKSHCTPPYTPSFTLDFKGPVSCQFRAPFTKPHIWDGNLNFLHSSYFSVIFYLLWTNHTMYHFKAQYMWAISRYFHWLGKLCIKPTRSCKSWPSKQGWLLHIMGVSCYTSCICITYRCNELKTHIQTKTILFVYVPIKKSHLVVVFSIFIAFTQGRRRCAVQPRWDPAWLDDKPCSCELNYNVVVQSNKNKNNCCISYKPNNL